MTVPKFNDKPLVETVADAIATADVDGATYEDLARVAIDTEYAWRARGHAYIAATADELADKLRDNNQEDDGA
jgi:hypothetical protein